jgi:hypothetical protein
MDSKIALSVTAISVSVLTFALSFWFTWRSTVAAKRPVLVLIYDGHAGWILRNIGGGPALNVVVAQKKTGAEWFNPVRVPPLAKDTEFALRWLGHVNTTDLGATYTDYEDRAYSSVCANDLSQSSRGSLFGPWPEDKIGRHWDQPMYRE